MPLRKRFQSFKKNLPVAISAFMFDDDDDDAVSVTDILCTPLVTSSIVLLEDIVLNRIIEII